MITDRSRDEVKRLVQQGEYTIRSLNHWDICKAREDKTSTLHGLAERFDVTPRAISKVIACKCPELKRS